MRRVRVYYNKKLFIAGTVLFASLALCLLLAFAIGTKGFKTEFIGNNLDIFLIPFFACIGLYILTLCAGNNAHMIFNEKGIEFRQAFKEPVFHNYSEYAYIEKAFYPYYGIPMHYIVLSNRRLSKNELSKINNVRISPTLLKIRYNKKNCAALLSIVPPRIASTIRAKFSDVPFGKFDFLFL